MPPLSMEGIVSGGPDTLPPVEYFIQDEATVVHPTETLLDASRRMVFDQTPAVVVWQEEPVGVLSFQDVLFAATAGRDLASTKVYELMEDLSRSKVQKGTDLESLLERYTRDLEIGVLVVDGERFVGLVTFMSIIRGLKRLKDRVEGEGILPSAPC